MARTQGVQYKPIRSEDKFELSPRDDSNGDSADPASAPVQSNEKRAWYILIASFFLFVLSILTFLAAYLRKPSELECHKIVSPYSPAWDAIELWEGHMVNYFNHSTIYRGPPTLEREKAWDELWHYHGVGVDAAGAAALNKTSDKHIPIIGSDPAHPRYGAMLEVFHQLHCLNLIRQYTWPLRMFKESWDDLYPTDLTEPVSARMHVDHCIETLRLGLMCYSDITPVFVDSAPHRMSRRQADFNVHHKCRKFEKVVDWIKENGVEIPELPLDENGNPL